MLKKYEQRPQQYNLLQSMAVGVVYETDELVHGVNVELPPLVQKETATQCMICPDLSSSQTKELTELIHECNEVLSDLPGD